MTAKKCTKKRDARAKVIEPMAFLTFSLPAPSSDLKVPIVYIIPCLHEKALRYSVDIDNLRQRHEDTSQARKRLQGLGGHFSLFLKNVLSKKRYPLTF